MLPESITALYLTSQNENLINLLTLDRSVYDADSQPSQSNVTFSSMVDILDNSSTI